MKRGIKPTANNHPAPLKLNPWNSNQPPINPSSRISQPLIRHHSRAIANLPQRAMLLSSNPFAVLGSPPMDAGPSHNTDVSHQLNFRKPNLPFQKTKRQPFRRQNCPLVVSHHENQIDKIDIVLDTNILLAYQHFLRALVPLLDSSSRLLVPAAVINELDLQKNRQHLVEVYEAGKCSSQRTMGSLARQVTKWLLDLVKPGLSHVVLQKIDEESDELKKNEDADTRILSYAHQLHRQARSHNPGQVVALLSNDNILRLRARSEGICSLAMEDFRHSPRQILACIRDIAPRYANPAIQPPPNTSLLNHSLARRALAPEPNLTNNLHRLTAKTCVPSGLDAQFTFTSLLPGSRQPATSTASIGPDQELIRLKSQIQRARSCVGCKSAIGSPPQVSPDQIHHYCPVCCEIICKGCMNVTECDWNCSGPFHGTECQTIKCCPIGRASIWIELMGQLDSCYLRNQYKISLKCGPKVTHHYGDEALIHYMRAAHALLIVSADEDERSRFLESILISSTMIDVLSQIFLCAPLLSWQLRSELFLSAIDVVRGILQNLAQPWKVLNSEFIKSKTSGISLLDHRPHLIVWRKTMETTNRPNATEAKIKELHNLFPNLMANVNRILHNQPGSSSATLQELLDHAVSVPLCYVLENLFQAAIEMETRQVDDHSVTLAGDIQVTIPLSADLVRMTSALMDLQNLYESHVVAQVNSTVTREPDSFDASKRHIDHSEADLTSSRKETFQADDRNVARDRTKNPNSKIKRAHGIKCVEENVCRSQAMDDGRNLGTRNAKGKQKEKASHKRQNETKENSKSDVKTGGDTTSRTDSHSNSPGAKIAGEIDTLSTSPLDSDGSDDSSDIIILN